MEDVFNKFRDLVNEGLKHGQTARGEPVDYIPTHILREHWNEDHIKEILYETAERLHMFPIQNIRAKFSQTFSIIVYISTTDRSYVRYMSWFNTHHTDDFSLPLIKKPSFLSDDDDADNFFRSFYEHQWKFCPAPLGPTKLYDRQLDPRQVLPFCRVGGTVSTNEIGRDAAVYRVKVDPSVQLPASNLPTDLVMLKVFPSDAVSLYQNEIKAYTSFENSTGCENILRCLGSYHTLSADGSGRECTIILEHADKGTLLDLYKRDNPPITFAETKAFWAGLCEVVFGLEFIHHTPSEVPTGTSIVHQDLKPSNIFTFSRHPDNNGEFNILLKIGDFGMSHVRKSSSRGRGSLGYDSRCTRTYCPPELHWGDDVEYRVGPLVDVWSIGCVLLEAAVWIAFGERGRLEFQQRRRDDNDETNPRQRALGRMDSFHDGIDRLNTVVDVLSLIERNGRKFDDLTPAIVRLILDHVLVPRMPRYNTRVFLGELDKRIMNSREAFPLTRPRSRVSSAELNRTSSHTRPSRTPEFVESPLSYPNTPTFPLTRNQTQTSPGDRTMSTFLTSTTRDFDYNVELSTETNKCLTPELDNTARGRPGRRDSALGLLHRAGTLHIPGGGSKQSLDTDISSTEEDLFSNNSGHSPAVTGYQSSVQRNQGGPWSPPARAQTNGTANSDSTITPRRQNQEETRSTFPQLSMEEVNQRRLLAAKDQRNRPLLRGKDQRYRPLLQGEDQAMPLLQKRDHIFLIDNSRTMQPFKDQVIFTFANLAHILETADEDGVDVICTSHMDNKENDRRTDNLVNFVQNNFCKGAGSRCLIERSLDPLITKVIQELPSQSGSGPRRTMSLRSILGKRDTGRPISIYILTNGVWDSSPAARDGVCNADKPIRRLIEELKRRNLPRNQVALQFIRFGNDETGIRRLRTLDDDIKGDFDIVDHKDSTGDVWPMLVGSLDEGTDLEENRPGNNNT